MTVSTWYLLSMFTMAYLGPFPEDRCRLAADILAQPGIVCKPAIAMKMCDVPDRPGVLTSCPIFDIPQITVRP